MKPLPRFVPVIHVRDADQAVEQTEVAFANGADGVFLIDHRRPAAKLLQSYQHVRRAHPEGWIGLNFLDLNPRQAFFYFPDCADALWFDDAPQVEPAWYAKMSSRRVFAGVAFKYQAQPEDLEAAARDVAKRFDVVTTSGDATGLAATPEKVRAIHQAVAPHPVALASGVTAQNVGSFRPYVDCFMVASSIGSTFHELDPLKVRELADVIQQ